MQCYRESGSGATAEYLLLSSCVIVSSYAVIHSNETYLLLWTQWSKIQQRCILAKDVSGHRRVIRKKKKKVKFPVKEIFSFLDEMWMEPHDEKRKKSESKKTPKSHINCATRRETKLVTGLEGNSYGEKMRPLSVQKRRLKGNLMALCSVFVSRSKEEAAELFSL